jgi:hypothetical protein
LELGEPGVDWLGHFTCDQRVLGLNPDPEKTIFFTNPGILYRIPACRTVKDIVRIVTDIHAKDLEIRKILKMLILNMIHSCRNIVDAEVEIVLQICIAH